MAAPADHAADPVAPTSTAAPAGTVPVDTVPVDMPVDTPPRRQDKRRARTRARLLHAARTTMGAKGIDAVTVAEIAEVADVAFGSFYNHFESKDAIVEALVLEMLDAVGEVIDAAIADIDDPVEALAVAFRMVQQASDLDPSWGSFMVRASVADDRLLDGLLARSRRDIQRGIDAGRLDVPDLDTAVIMLAGASLFATRGRIDGRLPADGDRASAEIMLRILGVPADEAARLAAKPLLRELDPGAAS